MKHLLLLLLISGIIGSNTRAQVMIYDGAFGNWLNANGFSQCLTPMPPYFIMDTSCYAIITETYLNISTFGAGMYNLDGIQYFDNLERLSCNNLNLQSIVKLPSSLKALYCNGNNLQTLPTLPQGLEELYCTYNSLTVLPALPSSLRSLDFSFNSIRSITDLPDTMDYLVCQYNPINMIQPIDYIEFFDFNNTNITCLRGYNYIDSSSPAMNTISLCPTSYITIPDANFLAWFQTHGYGPALNGNQLDTILAINIIQPGNRLNITNRNIANFTGLQYVRWQRGGISDTIDLSYNNLTRFPVQLYGQMNYLHIYMHHNSIDSFLLTKAFSPGPYNVAKTLDLSYNQLKSFQKDTGILNFVSIGHLNLSHNQLESFGPFTSNQGTGYMLNIRDNKLRKVPQGNFYIVDCGVNQIDSITNNIVGNTQFHTLICDSNNISYFYLTHSTYNNVKINCSYNRLTEFDTLPPKVMELICNDNQLTSLPPLGNVMTKLICYNNNIPEIKGVPNTLAELDCHNNPNLQCISSFPNRAAFKFTYTNTDFACLPAPYASCVYTATPPLAGTPTCGIFNPNGCPQTSNIEGWIYVDADSNCTRNAAELTPAQIKIQLLQANNILQQVFTDTAGHYSFTVAVTGSYTVRIDTTGQPFTVTCPDTANYVVRIDSLGQRVSAITFGIEVPPPPPAQPIDCSFAPDFGVSGFGSQLSLQQLLASVSVGDIMSPYGVHCFDSVLVTLQVTFDGQQTYSGPSNGSFPPTVSGNTLTWTDIYLGDIQPYSFTPRFNIPNGTPLGSIVCYTAIITTSLGDDNPINDTIRFCCTIAASFDPNNKLVDPAGNIEPFQEWLTYTINFQNTGNAPAEYVYVLDTLPNTLDINSIQLINASHYNVTQVLANGIVRFNFPDINLPDSTHNEPESHGFVRFKIRPQQNLPLGTVINNQVGIYFDYNTVVMTEATVNTIALPIPVLTADQLSFCEGDTSTLSALLSQNYQYQWIKDGAVIQTANGSTLIALDGGTYSLRLIYGNDTVNSNSVVINAHAATITSLVASDSTVCLTSAPVNITASPAGGTISGPGWVNNTFNPAVAGLGTHTLTYQLVDSNNCTATSSTAITVSNSLTVSAIPADNSVCEGVTNTAITLSPAGGTLAGTGVSGTTFNALVAGVGTHTITYSYTDADNCTGYDTSTVTVNANPVATITPSANTVCDDTTETAIAVSPMGGTLTGNGITGSFFTPTNGTGQYVLNYAYTDNNGCSDTATTTITVNALPVVTFTAPTAPLCINADETEDLTAYVNIAGGTFSGNGITGQDLDLSTPASYTISYTYTDGNNCSATDKASFVVDECIGIDAIADVSINVYPNPASTQIMIAANTSIEGASITVLDVTGRVILTEYAMGNNHKINTASVSNGLYLVIVIDQFFNPLGQSRVIIAK